MHVLFSLDVNPLPANIARYPMVAGCIPQLCVVRRQ